MKLGPSYRPLKPTLSLSSFQTPLKTCSFVVLKEWSSPFERHRQSSRGVGPSRNGARRNFIMYKFLGISDKPSSASDCGSLGVSLGSCTMGKMTRDALIPYCSREVFLVRGNNLELWEKLLYNFEFQI
ncbi:hypothetical protein V6N11_001820 [Hibiscus sabdariffa]|uniref:Uncharacterized protein n=1 Tax=Hibiscus sabdariffa TaxID=183260 RepID=A0ABR2QTL8_9ROSI